MPGSCAHSLNDPET
jgi:hypothetical protein